MAVHTLTVTARDLAGMALPGVAVSVRPYDQVLLSDGGATVLPDPLTAVTDGEGAAAVELVAGVAYAARLKSPGGQVWRKVFLMPDAATALSAVPASVEPQTPNTPNTPTLSLIHISEPTRPY